MDSFFLEIEQVLYKSLLRMNDELLLCACVDQILWGKSEDIPLRRVL